MTLQLTSLYTLPLTLVPMGFMSELVGVEKDVWSLIFVLISLQWKHMFTFVVLNHSWFGVIQSNGQLESANSIWHLGLNLKMMSLTIAPGNVIIYPSSFSVHYINYTNSLCHYRSVAEVWKSFCLLKIWSTPSARFSQYFKDGKVLLYNAYYAALLRTRVTTYLVARFSGVSEEGVKGHHGSLRDVQEMLLGFRNADTILIGHCLEKDLPFLKMYSFFFLSFSQLISHLPVAVLSRL